ncbi:MAG: hypothetical protein NTW87_13470 [Planctomycetota bacterium]|nr:hypothetical protein [Planctomycetota bacterium]
MLQKLSGCRLFVALTTVLASSCAVQAAEPPLLGDPSFQPSPERPVGWRGDGNGRFPAAEPPLVWSREAKAVKELRAQARKPKEGETGKPIPDGVVREWLVLGPRDIPAEKKSADDFGTNEDQYAPDENAKAGELAWKLATTDTSYVDFRSLFNKTLEKPDKAPWNPDEETRLVGYAHTWIDSPSGKPVFMNFLNSGTARAADVRRNLGKPHPYDRSSAKRRRAAGSRFPTRIRRQFGNPRRQQPRPSPEFSGAR